MPLTKNGKKILSNMKDRYGDKKAEAVFYATKNKGKIKGVEKAFAGKFFKASYDIGKKAFPGAKKAVQNFFKEEYGSARIHMSETSAFEYAKNATRRKFKELQFKKPTEKSAGGLMDYYKDLL